MAAKSGEAVQIGTREALNGRVVAKFDRSAILAGAGPVVTALFRVRRAVAVEFRGFANSGSLHRQFFAEKCETAAYLAFTADFFVINLKI